MIKIDNNRVYSTEAGAKVRRLRDGLVAGMMSAGAGDSAADYQEVPPLEVARLAAEAAEAERGRRRAELYAVTVSRLVHERYSLDDEVALLANAQCPALLADDDRAAELAGELEQYQAYRAECKARAAAMVEEMLAVENDTDGNNNLSD